LHFKGWRGLQKLCIFCVLRLWLTQTTCMHRNHKEMSYHINLIGQEERAAVASQVGSDRRKESLSKFGMEAQYMTTSNDSPGGVNPWRQSWAKRTGANMRNNWSPTAHRFYFGAFLSRRRNCSHLPSYFRADPASPPGLYHPGKDRAIWTMG